MTGLKQLMHLNQCPFFTIDEVKRLMEWLIKRLVKVGAKVAYLPGERGMFLWRPYSP
jgi:hypothetical protein